MTGWVLGQASGHPPDAPGSGSGVTTSRPPSTGVRIPDPGRTPFYGGALALAGFMGELARRTRSLATLVSTLDLLLLVGLAAFLAETIRVEGLGPPAGWTLLRALGGISAAVALALVIMTAMAGVRTIGGSRRAATAPATAHLLVVLFALLFVAFLLYWELLPLLT